MAQKIVLIDGIGEVVLQKRKGSRSIRLSVGHEGKLRVSLPAWSPYKVGEAFVRSKLDWILQQQAHKQTHLFSADERIGKAHRLKFMFEQRDAIASRVNATEIIIKLPLGSDPSGIPTQKIIKAAAMRALKQEAKLLLPGRLKALAAQHDFSYRSVVIKQLKTRWGSCSSRQEIALNCFLMQLPWDLIDYVLLHELLHTQIMAHGKPFWDELGRYVTNLPAKRKLMRDYQPNILPQQ